MLEEPSMEKKNSTRGAPGVAKPLPVETKNKQDVVSVARFPRYGRRRDYPVPKPDPPNKVWSHHQRSDKKIQGKNYYSGAGDRYRDQVAARDDAEVGTHAWSGSKKLNLNHLLNFKYDRPEGGRLSSSSWGAGGGSHSGSGRNRGMWVTRKHKYNKEQFLQANCQFVVQEGQDYSIYYADPDLLVDWDCIELIRVHSHELPSCPICLYPPVAAKMTRCGHIYCWPCILHYLALSDKTWRKCPICYEAVHKGDLKSAVTSATQCFAVGEEITMQLMQRERGSVVALPKNRWKKTNGNPFHVGDGVDVCYAKLLVATKDQVFRDIIEREERELTVALRESEGCPEICFVEFASQQLQERKAKLHGGDLAMDSITDDFDEKNRDVAVAVNIPDTLKTVTYASAFYDEVVDEAADEFKEIEVTDSDNTQGYEQRHRNESLGTDSVDDGDISERMNELEVREDICELTVEEKLPNKDVFYFYQATDGQHMYLHAINVHMLIREYGSLDQCPDTVTGVIVEKEGISMNEELRHRLRYLGHLPLICEFEVVELQLRPPIVSQVTVDAFMEELEKRRRRRSHRARAENKRERQLQAEENRKLGKIPSANIRLDSMKQFPECGSKLPSELDIGGGSGTRRIDSATGHNEPSPTCSSPTSSSPSAGSPENTTAGPSFAQMLCRGKAKPQTSWPSAPAVKSYGGGGNSDSEGDGFMAPPSFRDSFGAALQAAIDRNTLYQNIPDDDVAVGFDKSHKKKKGKQKRLLFTTNVIRNK